MARRDIPTDIRGLQGAYARGLDPAQLLLADGTRPKGFLCEFEAIRAARDISAFGGWRGYLAARG